MCTRAEKGGLPPHQNGHRRAPDNARLVRGFTLIEIVIVLAVTSMLSGIMILYGSSGRRLVSLSVDSAKLAQVIARAKSRAVAAEYDASDPACGYGVRADYAGKKRYALFRYRPGEGERCDAVSAVDAEHYDELETFSLSAGISFRETIDSAGDVLFIPPDPRTLLFRVDGARAYGARAFTLGTDDGLSEHSVGITSGGQISF